LTSVCFRSLSVNALKPRDLTNIEANIPVISRLYSCICLGFFFGGGDLELYVVPIMRWGRQQRCLFYFHRQSMNSFNKTKASVFPMQTMLREINLIISPAFEHVSAFNITSKSTLFNFEAPFRIATATNLFNAQNIPFKWSTQST